MLLHLPDEEATLALGRALAEALPPEPDFAILLLGPVGAGKTTLVRALVQTLPGGHKAEVASPSFNIVNLYPTRPEVAHFDLYRLEGMDPGETLLDSLEAHSTLVIVEWAQYLNRRLHPDSLVRLTWQDPQERGRRVEIEALGAAAESYLAKLNLEGVVAS